LSTRVAETPNKHQRWRPIGVDRGGVQTWLDAKTSAIGLTSHSARRPGQITQRVHTGDALTLGWWTSRDRVSIQIDPTAASDTTRLRGRTGDRRRKPFWASGFRQYSTATSNAMMSLRPGYRADRSAFSSKRWHHSGGAGGGPVGNSRRRMRSRRPLPEQRSGRGPRICRRGARPRGLLPQLCSDARARRRTGHRRHHGGGRRIVGSRAVAPLPQRGRHRSRRPGGAAGTGCTSPWRVAVALRSSSRRCFPNLLEGHKHP
jgi:hypothetical protein